VSRQGRFIVNKTPKPRRAKGSLAWALIALVLLLSVAAMFVMKYPRGSAASRAGDRPRLAYQERRPIDTGGFMAVLGKLDPWPPSASLEQVRDSFQRAGYRNIEQIDQILKRSNVPDQKKIVLILMKAALFNYEGEPRRAFQVLEEARSWLDDHDALAQQSLYTVIYFQGVTAIRMGENDNCILCRGESSCIVPIAPAAVHTKPDGSRLAIKHFTEYLEQFPDDLGVR